MNEAVPRPRGNRARSRAVLAAGTALVFAANQGAVWADGLPSGRAQDVPLASAGTVKTTFSVSEVAPKPFVETPPEKTGASFSIPQVPLSVVREDAAGNGDSTRAVNRLTSVAPLMPGTGTMPTENGPLWLGTHYGVKRLQNGAVRYYTQSDGLPGDYVEAVAANPKSGEAWCLVRRTGNSAQPVPNSSGSRTTPLVFCAWNRQTDSWRVAGEIFVPPPTMDFSDLNNRVGDPVARQAVQELQRQPARSVMAQSDHFVAFASSRVYRDGDALVYLWDKAAQKLRPVDMEPTLKKGAIPLIRVSFLHIDEARQTLWLGSSQGLFAYSLDTGAWRTFLSGRNISAGTIADGDAAALYVTCRVPNEPTDSVRGPLVPPDSEPPPPPLVPPLWQLERVALPTGEITQLATPPFVPSPYGSRANDGYDSLPITEPAHLFVDDDRNVWATLTRLPSRYYGGLTGGPEGIDKYAAKTKTWQHYALTPPRPFAVLPPGATAPAPDNTLSLLDTVPSGALVPLTQTPQEGSDSVHFDSMGYDSYSFLSYSPPPAYWIKHRFPTWYGKPEKISPLAFYSVGHRVDPSDARRVWFVQYNTLKTALQAPSTMRDDAPFDLPALSRVETIPLKATFDILRSPVQRVVSADVKNPGQVLVEGKEAFFLVDVNRKTWTNLPSENPNSVLYPANTTLLPSDENRPTLMQMRDGRNEKVRRWNRAARRWEVVDNLPVPKNSRLLGQGEKGAAWFVSNSSPETLFYQEPASPAGAAPPAAQPLTPQTPAAWGRREPQQLSPPFPVAAWGNVAWYDVPVQAAYFQQASGDEENTPSGNARNSLAGYNRVTKRWTPPLPLPHNLYEKPALLFSQNRTYAATTAGNPNGCVWEWNETGRSWKIIAPPLPLETGWFDNEDYPLRRPVMPVAVDAQFVWVLVFGRMMARYDRVSRKWDSVPLPAALRNRPAYSPSEQNGQDKVARIGPNTFCMGNEKSGLWRLRVAPALATAAKKTTRPSALPASWEPIERSVTVVSQSTPKYGIADFSLNHISVTPRFVWTIWRSQRAEPYTLAARWDKQAKTWKTWDEKTGFPLSENPSLIAADADSVWAASESGTYRYDEAADRWRLLVRSDYLPARAPSAARAGEKMPPLVGHVINVVPDAAGAYLLFLTAPVLPDTTLTTLVWRWDRATGALSPLPFPGDGGSGASVSHRARFGLTLLDEPGVLWIAETEGLWAWDKSRRQWSKPALPAFVSTPPRPNAIRRDGGALLLIENDAPSHVLRLAAPPFLKRP